MKKRILLMTAMFSVWSAMELQAGQLMNDGTGVRYVNDDGSLKTGWHQENADGSWYYFTGEVTICCPISACLSLLFLLCRYVSYFYRFSCN